MEKNNVSSLYLDGRYDISFCSAASCPLSGCCFRALTAGRLEDLKRRGLSVFPKSDFSEAVKDDSCRFFIGRDNGGAGPEKR